MVTSSVMGCSRKFLLLWMILDWVPKNLRISKKDNNSFCRIPNLADSKSSGIPEFCKTLNCFPGILVKIQKFFGKCKDFRSGTASIYYRISNVVHGACVDIFWNSPMPVTHWENIPCVPKMPDV